MMMMIRMTHSLVLCHHNLVLSLRAPLWNCPESCISLSEREQYILRQEQLEAGYLWQQRRQCIYGINGYKDKYVEYGTNGGIPSYEHFYTTVGAQRSLQLIPTHGHVPILLSQFIQMPTHLPCPLIGPTFRLSEQPFQCSVSGDLSPIR